MFKKKDPIFWWGWGIFAVGMVLYAVSEMDIFMVTIVIAFLLRPTLASMGLGKKYEDEREISIHFKSGNIAFLVVMIACVFYAAVSKTEKDLTAEMFYTVIIIGLATKGFVYVLLTKNILEAAPKILIIVGLFGALLPGLESIHHGIFSVSFIMNILPGLIIIGIGITSRTYPKVASIIMTVLTIALVSFILMKKNASGITAVIVGVPLFTASYGLWRGSKKNSDDQVEKPD